jgi:transcriptional regulator with XRE-family HTH domain
MNRHEPFHVRLSRVRSDRGVSTQDIRQATGISPTVLGHYETARHVPRYAALRLLAIHLDVSVDYLAGLTDECRRLGTPGPGGVFAERLKAARAARSMSQAKLGKALKTPVSRIAKWEAGEQPSYWSLVSVATRCRVSVDWLMGLSDEMEVACAV